MSTVARKVAACLMAHPDDCEFLAAGVLALLAQRGWEVHIITSTPGDCGSMEQGPGEIAAIRRKEGANAAAVIKGTYHCLEMRDLSVVFNEENCRRAATVLRAINPSLVITHSLVDYMLDHEETAKIARTATFGFPMPNYIGGRIPAPPDDCHVPHLYYADPLEGVDPYGQPIPPSLVVDVSTVVETKVAMLKEHASQREWLMKHQGVDEYTNSLRDWGKVRGRDIGVEYAEGFRQHLGHGYPKSCLLSDELGDLARKV